MSLRRAMLLLGAIIGIIIIASFAVWYFVRPEIQFFVYWVVGIVVAVLVALAAIVQITGYNLRDFLNASIPSPKLYTPDFPAWFQIPSLQRVDEPSASDKNILFDDLVSDLAKDSSKRVALVGKSGCGKTVALHAIMHTLSSHDNKVDYCIYVPLGSYAHGLMSTIKNNIGWQGVPDDQVINELEKPGAILLLDGLNEVPGTQREQCRNEIKTLMHSYQGGLVVSFPAVDRVHFGFDCPTYEILPLTAQQIRQIVTDFFARRGEGKKAEWFLDRFAPRGEFPPEFLQLAELPLNLRFLLELGSEAQFDLQSIRDLYGQVVARRFNQLERQEKKGKFLADVKKACLADVALQSLVDDSGLRMSKAFVRGIFSKKLSAVEASEILSEIIQSGLLNDAGDYVQWFHASLRDYLVGYCLCTLANSNQMLEEFPIEKPQWNGAVAYGIGLSTQPIADQSVTELLKRPAIFKELLRRNPTSEAVRAAVIEYHLSSMIGNCSNRQCTENDFRELRWGERFLDAYRQIASIARRENPAVGEGLPYPNGLKVLISPSGHFCVLILSDEAVIQFGDLAQFDSQVVQSVEKGKPCCGFCLHAHLLPAVDPEVVAFSQTSSWLKLMDRDNSGHYMDWLQDAAFCSAITPNEWVDWQSGSVDATINPGMRADQILLTWQEFYAPLTFCIDPVATPSRTTYFGTRTGSLRLTRIPTSQISLALILPWSPKTLQVDLGTRISVPFPTILLARDYSVHAMSMSYAKGGLSINFVHLRG